MNLSNVRFSLFLLFCISTTLRAEIPFPFEVPMSVLEMERPLSAKTHFVLLSAPKRINNQIRYEQREQIVGTGHEYLFWIDNDYPVKSVHEYFLRWLKASGELRYSCEQRGCESSNVWANEVFRQPKLYGRDSDQYYLVGTYVLDGRQFWITVYSVLNGRRHGYAYITLTEVVQTSSTALIQGQPFDVAMAERGDFSSILRELQQVPDASWWLVAYSVMPATSNVAEHLRLLQLETDTVSRLLIERAGLPAQRLRTHVAGPFSEPDPNLRADIWYRLFVQP
jgi:hypothetical protein